MGPVRGAGFPCHHFVPRQVVVAGEGVADRLSGSVTPVPVVDYPITHLVLAWLADQAYAPVAELVRIAQGLVPGA